MKKNKINLYKQLYTPNFTGKKKQVEECFGLLVVSNIKLKHDTVKNKSRDYVEFLFIFHLYQITLKLKSVASTKTEIHLGCKHEHDFNRG